MVAEKGPRCSRRREIAVSPQWGEHTYLVYGGIRSCAHLAHLARTSSNGDSSARHHSSAYLRYNLRPFKLSRPTTATTRRTAATAGRYVATVRAFLNLLFLSFSFYLLRFLSFPIVNSARIL